MPTIRTKRQRLLEVVLILYNNAQPRTIAHTRETLQELKFEALNIQHTVLTLYLWISICLDV
jgi:hypothetical protein